MSALGGRGLCCGRCRRLAWRVLVCLSGRMSRERGVGRGCSGRAVLNRGAVRVRWAEELYGYTPASLLSVVGVDMCVLLGLLQGGGGGGGGGARAAVVV